MDVVSVLHFLYGLGDRRQMAVAAATLLAVLALLVSAVALGVIGGSSPANGFAFGPFRWAAESIGLG